MESTRLIFLWVIFLFGLSFTPSSSLLQENLVCPESGRISPCNCSQATSQNPHPLIQCVSQNLSQSHLDDLFVALREVNQGDLNRIPIRLVVTQTNLTQVNLTPLIGGCFRSIQISRNLQLTSIVGPPKYGNNDTTLIDVTILEITDNPLLSTAGLETTLGHFTRRVSQLSLKGNGLTFQKNQSQGFLPSLSNFTSLSQLDLSSNRIEILSGKIFKNNRNLTRLILRNNGLREISGFAFEIDAPEQPLNGKFFIDLAGNNIGDKSVGVDSGLNVTHRPTHVSFTSNKLQTLGEDRFRSFLYAPSGVNNSMWFRYNNFSCDDRMFWLKKARKELETRVTGVDCQNDIGYTVFNTSKITTSGAQQMQFSASLLAGVCAICLYFTKSV